ncbi:transcription initiation factor IIF: small subunit-like protein [Dinothrombium tinctorium]|uniref:General transcription factor IIF subunit 2 n=1 Tax=Dinothrombium tinctorium TaxID=1965070 RepID=A0A3S3PWN6_9ACAR|nr:transcription initiation factor IIF: small subunit-like protein [Dinothrombium tinctorium]RWR99075.1 transcription initiation factor IIF: small subunit-like protein [Dinothrombium tinctorium]
MSASSSAKELNVENASRGVWLVKVPKYISSRWERAPPLSEVGRLKITKGPGGKPEILFDLSDDLVAMKDAQNSSGSTSKDQPVIPKAHRFTISDISNQHLAVFSHSEDEKGNQVLAVEGNVVQKGECRPMGDNKYMALKKKTIVAARQPTKQVLQLDKAVVNYKPIAAHKADIEFEQRRKAEGKKSREDKDKVMDVLFAAFEKHQYYNIKDLERITKQPIPYLKEILKEICIYNAKNPHKNMWELKPEYRHYTASDKS